MKVALIYYRLMDGAGLNQLIGGIETYLLRLSEICAEIGWETTLFQVSKNEFIKKLNSLKVIGVPISLQKLQIQKKLLYQKALNYIGSDGIIIFGADHISVPTNNKRCISIQHGISWDLPAKYTTQKEYLKQGLGASIKKKRLVMNALKYFNNCLNRVCVDYNFLNWYRTCIGDELEGRIWVIPNFCIPVKDIENKIKQKRDHIKILFARRFTKYRGTGIVAEAAKTILKRYNNVKFTFAGEGPEEEWLKNQFKNEDRVSFIKYLPQEASDIHYDHDIAVVPSIASEGTSFSVIEAMGAGCAVVATAVGGITNLIIDGFNGVLTMPNANSFLSGLESIINDSVKRKELQINAFKTAKNALSYDLWKTKWKNVLLEVANEQLC